MARALSVDNIYKTKYDVFDFKDKWEEFVNKPERGGVWFVYAPSASGKSEFMMMLARQMTKFGTVLYNAREEGKGAHSVAKSFRDRMERHKMHEVKKRFMVVNEDKPTLEKRLDKRRSPDILIIDSLQYFKMSFKEYRAFVDKYCGQQGKTIIIVGHAKGSKPKGNLGEDISYDAYIKIYIDSFVAYSKGREIGSKGFLVIWEEGANKVHGEKIKSKK